MNKTLHALQKAYVEHDKRSLIKVKLLASLKVSAALQMHIFCKKLRFLTK